MFTNRRPVLVLFLVLLHTFGIVQSDAKNPAPASVTSSTENLTCGGFPVSKEHKPEMGPFIVDLQNRIRKNWKFSDDLLRTKTRRIVAKFYVDCAGNISGLKIKNTSWNPALDQAALKAIQDSAPFMPLPLEFSAKTPLGMEYTFSPYY